MLRIKELREFLKLNQSEFAKNAMLSCAVISTLERDEECNANVNTAMKISSEYGVSVDWLLGLSNKTIEEELGKEVSDLVPREELITLEKQYSNEISCLKESHSVEINSLKYDSNEHFLKGYQCKQENLRLQGLIVKLTAKLLEKE